MKLGTKSRYAVIAMLDLAVHSKDENIVLATIAKRQGLSLSYLEQLFSKLKNKSLVTSVKGPNGGYKLARNPEDITISNIIQAVDEKIETTHCRGNKNCSVLSSTCMAHHLWEDLMYKIQDYLTEVSLASVIKNKKSVAKNTLNHAVDAVEYISTY